MAKQPITQFVQQQIDDDSFQEKLIDHILNFDPLDPNTALDTSSPQPLFLIPKLPPRNQLETRKWQVGTETGAESKKTKTRCGTAPGGCIDCNMDGGGSAGTLRCAHSGKKKSYGLVFVCSQLGERF